MWNGSNGLESGFLSQESAACHFRKRETRICQPAAPAVYVSTDFNPRVHIMSYVDGFVLVVPKKNLKAYAAMSRKAGKVWREHGALDYRECAADDLDIQGIALTFPKLVKLKTGETVVFAYIVYKSRAHRDRVNAKVMKDPRITGTAHQKMPFDPKRMSYGGFKTIVQA